MPEILINVINKIPQLSGDVRQITADNADYTIRFAFDDDWREGEKRVYFVRENGFAYPVGLTEDDIASVPSVNGVQLRTSLFVGVQQGSVKTSRPCMIPVYRAITDMIDDSAVQPEPSMWEDVLKRLEKLEKNGGGSGGTAFETGFGLSLEDGVLSAEVGAESFHEITNEELQEIINKVKAEG